MDDPQFGAAADDSGVPEQLQDQDEAELADLGLGPDEEYQDQGGEGDDDGNHEVYADEAEEEQAPVANAAMRRRQREHEQHLALLEQVKALNIKMEKAIEDDAVDVSEGRPGPRKLAMINEVTTFLMIEPSHKSNPKLRRLQLDYDRYTAMPG